MKKFLSLICVTAILLTLCVSGASAMRAPTYAGDVNLDWEVSVSDATLIQKYLAGMVEFTLFQEILADTDNDGKITILDATLIQKDIAEIAHIESEDIFPYLIEEYFYSDYDSGKAMCGVPVTFYASAYAYDERSYPVTYEFYVNDELVQERSEQSTFTYTFEKPGSYDICAISYNTFEYSESLSGYYDYIVVEPYESEAPVISSVYCTEQTGSDLWFDIWEQEELTFVTNAIKGSGEYEYSFLIDGIMIQDFSENNTFSYWFEEPEYNFDDDDHTRKYHLEIFVRDKVSNITTQEAYDIIITSGYIYG